jgi:hypothetical protein
VVGPVGTLVLEGPENSRIVLSAIGADEVLSMGLMVFVSRVERNFRGIMTWGRTLLTSDSRLSLKLDGRSEPIMHYSAYTRVEQG